MRRTSIPRCRGTFSLWTAGAAAIVLTACSGGGERQATDTTAAPAQAPATTPAESTPAGTTGAAPAGTTGTAGGAVAPGATTGGGAANPSAITPQMIALGDSIFHGQAAGGLCYTCHGPNAKGTQLAPDLTDSQWLNGDGSYQFIENTVTHGVPNPKQHAAPMPPMGGASLSQEQVQAVSAYVYSLTHPDVGKR